MSDYDDDLDLDIPDLRKADRAKAKRIKELEAEITSLRQQGRERAVKDVLTAKGVNNPAKIARLIPADVSAETEVEAWLTEYADVFGVTTTDGDAADTEPKPNAFSQGDVDAFNQINAVGSGVPIESSDDLVSRIQNAESQEDLMAMLRGTK